MTDVFFSYSSKDRERVRPIRDALVAEGFDVFWDQEVPPGRNWDEWIRQYLDAARCVIVFWSVASVKSDNVVHEATIAKNAGKLIPVLLDPIEANQFPMGHYTTQGIALPPEGMAPATFQRLRAEVETKAMRRWMRRRLSEQEGKVNSLTAAHEQIKEDARRIVALENAVDQGRREHAKLQAALLSSQKDVERLRNSLNAGHINPVHDEPKNGWGRRSVLWRTITVILSLTTLSSALSIVFGILLSIRGTPSGQDAGAVFLLMGVTFFIMCAPFLYMRINSYIVKK